MPGHSSLAELLASKRGLRLRLKPPRLHLTEILAWADDHRRRTGEWPTEESGPIPASPGETWLSVSKALRKGKRGLLRSSISQLLAKHRNVNGRLRSPPLSEAEILKWADDFRTKNGKWPKASSGRIAGAKSENWARINNALHVGCRGLSGGSSLGLLLSAKRSARVKAALPSLSPMKIKAWVRFYVARHGRAPTRASGPIPNTGGETWSGVDNALKYVRRGIKSKSSLSELVRAEGFSARGSVAASC
jgi:hypothetical protein